MEVSQSPGATPTQSPWIPPELACSVSIERFAQEVVQNRDVDLVVTAISCGPDKATVSKTRL